MIIEIAKLQNNIEKQIKVEGEAKFPKENLKKSGIIDIKELYVEGFLSKNNQDEYIIDVIVSGILVLPCSLSLKPVDYSINTKISGNVYELLEEIGENYKKSEKTIDILPIIWENVLMEIPIKVVSEDLGDIKTEGDGWELVTGEKENINPELAKLSELLKERGV